MKRGSSQDRDGKSRASQPSQRDIGGERYSVDFEDDYVEVGMGSSSLPAFETRGGRRVMMQRMKGMPLHSHSHWQSPSQLHIHSNSNPNNPPSLNSRRQD